jgi:hypothetical protein
MVLVARSIPSVGARMQKTTMNAKCLAIAVLILVAGRASAEEVRGIIVKVDPDKKQLVLEGKNRGFKGMVLHLKVRDDTEILVGRKPAKLADLVAGKRARVLFETQGNEPVALRISVADLSAVAEALRNLTGGLQSSEPAPPPGISSEKAPSDLSSVSGTLRRIARTDREIVVVGPGASKNSEVETTFLVPDNVTILRGQKLLRLEDLHEGERVTVSGEKKVGKLVAKSIKVER